MLLASMAIVIIYNINNILKICGIALKRKESYIRQRSKDATFHYYLQSHIQRVKVHDFFFLFTLLGILVLELPECVMYILTSTLNY